MERKEAVQKLQQLVGKELHELANEYAVTIFQCLRWECIS